MLFSEIIGHDKIKQQLVKSHSTGRIAHAQLFTSTQGGGGYPMALAYATYIMCKNPSATDACGVCSECYKMNKLEHPDCHMVFPVNDAKTQSDNPPTSDKYIKQWREFIVGNGGYFSVAQWYGKLAIENKQGIIRREEAAQLYAKLSLKSYEGGYKIAIVYLPELFKNEAANALLKIIEEPPAKTLFILVSENPDNIITTIKSRAQYISMRAVDDNVIAQNLIARNLVSDAKIAGKIAHSAMGSWETALSIANENAQKSQVAEQFVALMRLCYTSDYIAIFQWVETFIPLGRETHKEFANYSLMMFRNCYMKNLGLNHLAFVVPSAEQFTDKFAPFVGGKQIEQFVEQYELLLRDLFQNANAKILFTHFALSLCKIFAEAKKDLI